MERFKMEKLKARIIDRYKTQKAFAEALGVPESTLCRYLGEGRNWRGDLLIKAIRLLEISNDEIDAYFFEPRVAKRERKAVRK